VDRGGNVTTDIQTAIMPVPLVNESNGDLYVAYLRGSLGNAVNVYYKKSIDGGANWSNESNIVSPGIFDDVKALRGNLLSPERLYLFWYNDDLSDIYGNIVEDNWRLNMSTLLEFLQILTLLTLVRLWRPRTHP
jgi:hypothetical protein